MIPRLYIEQWQTIAPWKSLSMIEQDLIISRALVNLFNHSEVAKSLGSVDISPAAYVPRLVRGIQWISIIGKFLHTDRANLD